jgi:drug/metabolite transporter (DMT)-like permease
MLYLALCAGALLAAAGQVMLKLGADGRLDALEFVNRHVIAGLAFYGLGMILWLLALARLPLHVVYPFTMLTLGLVFTASIVLFGERPSPLVIAGWCVVSLGVAIVAWGARG